MERRPEGRQGRQEVRAARADGCRGMCAWNHGGTQVCGTHAARGQGTGTGMGTGTGTGWARRDFISAHSWLFHKENNSRIGIRVIKYTPL